MKPEKALQCVSIINYRKPLMYSHLHALELRLSNTQRRSVSCKPHQSTFWAVEIAQIKKEIAGEYKFLGIVPAIIEAITDDELLNALS